MQNVRIADLPCSRSVADKDCQQCTKRRIKCDRTLPCCQKCTVRQLECPGYQQLLRWDQGVASRGKLKGKAIPTNDGSFTESSQTAENKVTHGVPAARWTVSSSTTMSNQISSRLLAGILLEHFRCEISPRLTWLDGPSNPWRTLVQPLITTSSAAYLSMLYLAVAHLSSSALVTPDQQDQAKHAKHDLRGRALRILRTGVETEMQGLNQGNDSNAVQMLASTLIFAHAEMLVPQSQEWKLHLRACHVMLGRYRKSAGSDDSGAPYVNFIMAELNDIQVLFSLSAFDANDIEQARPQVPDANDLNDSFWSFTSIMRDLTLYERSHCAPNTGSYSDDVDIAVWQHRIERAFAGAYAELVGRASGSAGSISDFQTIINAHYHALTIYLYQVYRIPEVWKLSLVDGLMQAIHCARESGRYNHDLFWPLFIFGTESYNDSKRQAVVIAHWKTCMSYTGFWCNEQALVFLQTYWARPLAEQRLSWIDFARSHTSSIDSFLIF